MICYQMEPELQYGTLEVDGNLNNEEIYGWNTLNCVIVKIGSQNMDVMVKYRQLLWLKSENWKQIFMKQLEKGKILHHYLPYRCLKTIMFIIIIHIIVGRKACLRTGSLRLFGYDLDTVCSFSINLWPLYHFLQLRKCILFTIYWP